MARKPKDATAAQKIAAVVAGTVGLPEQIVTAMLIPVEEAMLASDMELLEGIDIEGMSDEDLLALLAAQDEAAALAAASAETIAETVIANTVGAEEVEPAVERLQDLIADVSKADAQIRSEETAFQFNERADYEESMRPENDKIQTKLKGYKGKMVALPIATVMVAANLSPNFINRQMVEGRRFNVYSIDKMTDLLAGLAHGTFRNAVNIAVMKSMFKFRAAGMAFSGLAALAATSDKVKIDKGMAGLLIRHTVDAGTAPTQSSSTMNALSVLGIVTNKGSQKFPLWELTNSPAARRAEEILLAA